jgi:hypothetical protein
VAQPVPAALAVAAERQEVPAVRDHVEEDRADHEARHALRDELEQLGRARRPPPAPDRAEHAERHAEEQLEEERRERELGRRPRAVGEQLAHRPPGVEAVAEIAARDALEPAAVLHEHALVEAVVGAGPLDRRLIGVLPEQDLRRIRRDRHGHRERRRDDEPDDHRRPAEAREQEPDHRATFGSKRARSPAASRWNAATATKIASAGASTRCGAVR